MKQSVSHYMMPHDREEDIEKTLRKLHLDGIENLIYGTEPALHPADGITLGCHLAYWPDWMDFYLGKKDFYEKDFPTKQSLTDTFGGTTVEAWIEKIRRNIRAALAEKPEYLVWHVAHCSLDEIWTRRFCYSSHDVLKAAAEVYGAVAEEVPPSVTVLFENIFWPGLYTLEPKEVDYFFSLLPGKNIGIMLDTGHLMNTNPRLATEEGGARYVKGVVNRLGSMKSLILGIHLSCSLSGAYQRSLPGTIPTSVTPDIISRHIISIDQHRPFTTSAARDIMDCVEPRYVTHELFGRDFSIPEDKVRLQMKAAGLWDRS
ncbi:MAG TPA: sugar phosphate isomerase/epimerase [Veillonellaceae bacterium]|nr:sugar phosphate isomerase/epimerase [Veillonellaceae bacterium]